MFSARTTPAIASRNTEGNEADAGTPPSNQQTAGEQGRQPDRIRPHCIPTKIHHTAIFCPRENAPPGKRTQRHAQEAAAPAKVLTTAQAKKIHPLIPRLTFFFAFFFLTSIRSFFCAGCCKSATRIDAGFEIKTSGGFSRNSPHQVRAQISGATAVAEIP